MVGQLCTLTLYHDPDRSQLVGQLSILPFDHDPNRSQLVQLSTLTLTALSWSFNCEHYPYTMTLTVPSWSVNCVY